MLGTMMALFNKENKRLVCYEASFDIKKGFIFMFKQPVLLSCEYYWVQESLIFNLYDKMGFECDSNYES